MCVWQGLEERDSGCWEAGWEHTSVIEAVAGETGTGAPEVGKITRVCLRDALDVSLNVRMGRG